MTDKDPGELMTDTSTGEYLLWSILGITGREQDWERARRSRDLTLERVMKEIVGREWQGELFFKGRIHDQDLIMLRCWKKRQLDDAL